MKAIDELLGGVAHSFNDALNPPVIKKKIATVVIAIPSGDMVHAHFAMSLAGMCYSPGARIAITNGQSSVVAAARNQCVDAALQLSTEYLFFLDSDMIFPVHTLARLLSHNKDIVGGTYVRRHPPHLMLGHFKGSPEKIDTTVDLIEMDAMPTGCLLIKTEILRRMKRPIFRFGVDELANEIIGEDITFCRMARKLGYTVWLDMPLSMQLKHIGSYAYSIAEMVAEKQIATQENG